MTTSATESKQEPQSQLEQTLDYAIEGCQIISPGFRYLYVNRAVAQQGHSTKDRLIGRTMMEVYPGIEQTEMFKNLRRCMKTKRPKHMENEFRFPDGSMGWFELKMERVPEGVLILSSDISKRKLAEESLLTAVKNLRKAKDEINLEKITDQAILQSVGEGLIAIDSKARIMMINKAAEQMLGRTSRELKNKPITRLTMLDSEGQYISTTKRPIFSVLKKGTSLGPYLTGYYFTHKENGKFPVGITITPIRLGGKIIGAIEVFRDITKEQEIDRAKTEFVSIASHQLRTPLGLTKWYLEALREESKNTLSDTCQGYLDEIFKSSERVLRVVRELLSVSRIDQGRTPDDPKPTNIVSVVKEILQEMLPIAAAKNIDLSSRIVRTKLPAIAIDQMRLHEVIQNLVANALEYTPAGGRVTVSVGRVRRQLCISVADTGIGINRADQKHLFSKFFRSERAVQKNPDGSGLGLYVVKSYVEGWGGKISVSSQEDRGTTFTITLPIKEAKKHEKNLNN